MSMLLHEMVALLGFSNSHKGLASLLASVGFDIGSLSKRKLRAQGMVGIELLALGLALTFEEREGYERETAPAKDDGEAILAGIFAYAAGGRRYAPYAGAIPFSKGPIRSREDALRAFGEPARTEVDEDEGSIDWDQWIKDGIQLRTTYRGDGSLKVISFSYPFK